GGPRRLRGVRDRPPPELLAREHALPDPRLHGRPAGAGCRWRALTSSRGAKAATSPGGRDRAAARDAARLPRARPGLRGGRAGERPPARSGAPRRRRALAPPPPAP